MRKLTLIFIYCDFHYLRKNCLNMKLDFFNVFTLIKYSLAAQQSLNISKSDKKRRRSYVTETDDKVCHSEEYSSYPLVQISQ